MRKSKQTEDDQNTKKRSYQNETKQTQECTFCLRIPFLVIHGSAKINGPCCHDFYIMMIESDSSSEQDLRHDVNSQTRQQSNELYTAFLQQIE